MIEYISLAYNKWNYNAGTSQYCNYRDHWKQKMHDYFHISWSSATRKLESWIILQASGSVWNTNIGAKTLIGISDIYKYYNTWSISWIIIAHGKGLWMRTLFNYTTNIFSSFFAFRILISVIDPKRSSFAFWACLCFCIGIGDLLFVMPD